MKAAVIDFGKFENAKEVHAYLKEVISFPDYYGANLDALPDCLTDMSEEENRILRQTPSSALGSCRYKLPEINGHEDVYEKMFEIMEKYNIEYFFYIGGNDSMDTIKALSDYALAHDKTQRFVGVPKTIDNDLPITDHTPGYGSAAKFIAT